MTTSQSRSGPLHKIASAVRNPSSVGALAISVLVLLANAINYLTNVMLSHLLTSAAFGELVALLAVYTILAVPGGAAQVVVANKVAAQDAAGRREGVGELIRYAFGHGAALGVLAATAYAVAIPLVVIVRHLGDALTAFAIVPLTAVAFIQPIQIGLFQGLGWFTRLGVLLALLAVLQLVLAAAFTIAGGGPAGAIFGEALGTGVALSIAAYWSRDIIRAGTHGAALSGFRRRPSRRSAFAVLTFTAFALVSNLDTILARVLLSAHDAGIYAAIATIGKVVLFLPTAIAYILVPGLARARQSAGDVLAPLRRGARWTVGIGLFGHRGG